MIILMDSCFFGKNQGILRSKFHQKLLSFIEIYILAQKSVCFLFYFLAGVLCLSLVVWVWVCVCYIIEFVWEQIWVFCIWLHFVDRFVALILSHVCIQSEAHVMSHTELRFCLICQKWSMWIITLHVKDSQIIAVHAQ